jgi:Flp pilus assembly protein TadG
MRLRHPRRRGASMVEAAIVTPIFLLIIFGMFIWGLRIFYYQQVARVARDASRWASVHGTVYAQTTSNTAATASAVYTNAIVPNATGLNLSNLTYSVTWNTSNSPYHQTTASGVTTNVANTVTVTINYSYTSIYAFGGLTVTSTSTTVMSF